jgi:O-methyltransferase
MGTPGGFAIWSSEGDKMSTFLMKIYYVMSVPLSIWFILNSNEIHPAYGMGWLRKFGLGFRMFINTLRIETATSYKAHLAMALKLLEMPPEIAGDVVECGTWKGGSATNLSLICRIVGRNLVIYDSFEGLPAGDPLDREAPGYQPGDYKGTVDEVKRNISRYGAAERCEFVKGYFQETLPSLSRPIVLAFLDVDLEASLATCVRHVWRNLVAGGFIFTDECVGTDYVALFYSERWWKENFAATPPGLIGAGTGLPLGDYYIGPYSRRAAHPAQHASTGGYTFKGMSGHWTYYEGRAE